jgi:hypothetical protein
MPIVVELSDPKDAEKTTMEIASFLLDLAWRISRDTEICPICLMEVMHDMVATAHADGKIEHVRMSLREGETDEDTMGEPITSTIQ